jgi:hypothetical protein
VKITTAFAAWLLWLVPLSANAAVTVDATPTASCGSASGAKPFTCSTLTVTAAGDVVVAFAMLSTSGGTLGTPSATWDGVSMGAAVALVNDTSSFQAIMIFCLAAPHTGNKVLSFSWTGTNASSAVVTGAMSFKGADQTTPCKNPAFGANNNVGATSQSAVITTAVGDYVVGHHTQTQATMTGNGTTLYNDATFWGVLVNYAAGAAGTVTLTATTSSGNATWDSEGLDVAAAAGGDTLMAAIWLSILGAVLVSAPIGVVIFGLVRRERERVWVEPVALLMPPSETPLPDRWERHRDKVIR